MWKNELLALESAYTLVNTHIKNLNCAKLISLLNTVLFLDIINFAENQEVIINAITKQLVDEYILKNNISLDNKTLPLNFSSEDNIEDLGSLFEKFTDDLHPLIKNYIILKTLGNELKKYEKNELAGKIDKNKSIKRADGLYILKTVYDIVNPSINNFDCIQLIALLNGAFFLDTIGSAENQKVLAESITKQLINQYISEKKYFLKIGLYL